MVDGTQKCPISGSNNEQCVYFCFSLMEPHTAITEGQVGAPTNSWAADHLSFSMERSLEALLCPWSEASSVSWSSKVNAKIQLIFFLVSKTKGDRFPDFFQHSSSLPIGHLLQGLPRGCSAVKNLPANAGDLRNVDSIPGLVRSPGEGNGNPPQYSCLRNPMDGGAWWTVVHRVMKELDTSQ